MQMRLTIGGFGIGIAGNLGASFGQAVHLSFRNAPSEGSWSVSIYDHFELPSDGPHGFLAALSSEWFTFNVSCNPWLRKKQYLLDKHMRVELKEPTTGLGGHTTTVAITLIAQHQAVGSATFYNVPLISNSTSLETFTIEGRVRPHGLRTENAIESE